MAEVFKYQICRLGLGVDSTLTTKYKYQLNEKPPGWKDGGEGNQISSTDSYIPNTIINSTKNRQAGRMVAEDLELTVETLRCKEDKEASGLVKKVELLIQGASKSC